MQYQWEAVESYYAERVSVPASYGKTIICKNNRQLIKACALEIVSREERYLIYNNELWHVLLISPHAIENGLIELTAYMLANESRNILVVPNCSNKPTHWIYYMSERK